MITNFLFGFLIGTATVQIVVPIIIGFFNLNKLWRTLYGR